MEEQRSRGCLILIYDKGDQVVKEIMHTRDRKRPERAVEPLPHNSSYSYAFDPTKPSKCVALANGRPSVSLLSVGPGGRVAKASRNHGSSGASLSGPLPDKRLSATDLWGC